MRKGLYIGILGLLAVLVSIGGVALFYRDYQSQLAQNVLLEKKLKEAQEISKEAIVTRRVSAQLEEIAYQQKDISDQQRQEALRQKQIADEMRIHAENEQEKALDAQQAAIEAYSEMEAQKRLADQHREEAVAAHMKADTLARLALVRSLSSEALSQYDAGNGELAALLCYSAWKFTVENRGDLYQPTFFDALLAISDQFNYKDLHSGPIRSMYLVDSALVSTSQEGEVALWRVRADEVELDTILFQNNRFDLRHVQVDREGNCWAAAYDGHLLRIDLRERRVSKIYETGLIAPVGLVVSDRSLWLMTKSGQLFRSALDEIRFEEIYAHAQEVLTFADSAQGLLFGDQAGAVYKIGREGQATCLLSGSGQGVTCLNGERPGQLFVGYKSGLIKQVDLKTRQTHDLVSHVSALTGMALFGEYLLSSSLDGSVRLWRLGSERIISSEIYYSSNWIRSLVFWNPGLMVIVGDERGRCTRFSISPERMASEIKQHLSRNLTKEEWQYYIGELAEYEAYR